MEKNGKNRYRDEEEEPGRLDRLRIKVKEIIRFLSYDIWRSNPETLSNKKNILYNAIKIVMLTVRNVQELNIAASSRSLTYRTLLSIVPLLAVIFAIARGFGIENIMESSIFNLMTGEKTDTIEIVAQTVTLPDTAVIGIEALNSINSGRVAPSDVGADRIQFQEEATAEGRTREFLNLLFQLIKNSLEEAKGGGVFAGVGILLFLYTILLLFNDIESNLNKIWQVSKGRSIGRKVTDYSAMVLFIPLFFILVNALNIISYPQNNTLKIIYILYPFIPRLLNIIPFVVMILIFTAVYKYLPNVKVKFQNALLAGILAGVAFQFFQMLYLSGQLWITRYNAIYGTFAAIPLMLLWIQLSWFITLIGAEVSYAAQNVRKFSFEKETRNISRRYRDFFTLMIASVIIRRFAEELPPYTADQISEKCKVPSRLTHDILDELMEINVISATPSPEDELVMAFQPAVDINLISVNYLMAKLDEKGSEDFMIDMEGEFHEHWNVLVNTRLCMYENNSDLLLKDL
ncbi:YihY/virulence factor BrkB family protein [Proteiniphilum sp. UBA1028]|jgi:membrane protein|uniref:YihY/virulence factor BrkB family protein n=1 Tax=Proteiniphilum sp. UBA1028 TaxID=1947251 RepID=UPI000E8C427A|nr:YihY/virulence factor BrkB family protein [Proteiniphilum sp. UBA1028]HBG59023.1 YihY/virulence factor BrkB family protein [Porphyromonadaceae bacterium]